MGDDIMTDLDDLYKTRIKDLESQVAKLKAWQDEQIIVYNDIKREASEYRNEVAKLKEEIHTRSLWDKQQSKLCAEQHQQIEQLQSTLDEIKTLAEGMPNYNIKRDFQKVLAKHEGKK